MNRQITDGFKTARQKNKFGATFDVCRGIMIDDTITIQQDHLIGYGERRIQFHKPGLSVSWMISFTRQR
jgi:hypothetical protein